MKYSIKIILIILSIILVLGVVIWIKYEKNSLEYSKTIETSENLISLEMENEKTIENVKLVLKSNYENDCEKKIIYIFENEILQGVKTYEKYINEEDYNEKKEIYENRTDIEIIEENKENLIIYYKKMDLGLDMELSYREVYDKYIGILGAYEVI